jgi:hypothetical protein
MTFSKPGGLSGSAKVPGEINNIGLYKKYSYSMGS